MYTQATKEQLKLESKAQTAAWMALLNIWWVFDESAELASSILFWLGQVNKEVVCRVTGTEALKLWVSPTILAPMTRAPRVFVKQPGVITPFLRMHSRGEVIGH